MYLYTCIKKGLSLIYKIGECIVIQKRNIKQTKIPAKEKQRYKILLPFIFISLRMSEKKDNQFFGVDVIVIC